LILPGRIGKLFIEGSILVLMLSFRKGSGN
jgi:hypothetical protein